MRELLGLAELYLRTVLVFVVADRVRRNELELLVALSHRLLFERCLGKIDVSLGGDRLRVEGGLLDGLIMLRHGLVQDPVRTLVAGPSLPWPERLIVPATPLALAVARARSVIAPLPAAALTTAADCGDSLPISRIQIYVLICELNADGRPLPFGVGEILLRKMLELLLDRLGNLLGFISSRVLRRIVWQHLIVVRRRLLLLRLGLQRVQLPLDGLELRLKVPVRFEISSLLHANDSPLYLLHIGVDEPRDLSERHHLLDSVRLP